MKKLKAQVSNKYLIAAAVDLSSLVDYQKDSIVSREIIKKNTGSVTVFAFDQGQGLSEHIAPFDAFVYILDGKAKINISGKLHLVKKGQMIVLPASKPHSLMAEKKFKMVLVMIKGDK